MTDSGPSGRPDGRTITEYELEQCARANQTGRQPVVFVHGLWLLPSSWDRWAKLFEDSGYVALTPGWSDDPETVEEADALTPEEEKKYMAGSIATGSMLLSDPRNSAARPHGAAIVIALSCDGPIGGCGAGAGGELAEGAGEVGSGVGLTWSSVATCRP